MRQHLKNSDMKSIFNRIVLLAAAIAVSSCFGIGDEDFRELSPITFSGVPDVIEVSLGEELVLDELTITSELPVSCEWAYGPKTGDNTMGSCTVISTDREIRHTFNRIGTYILRLKADNGESIVFKYFTLNVNSGFDEGILILNNGSGGQCSLTFIKKLQENASEDEQEIYPDIFSTINPGQTLSNGTDIYLSYHESGNVEYSSLLVSTDDENGTIYKLEPKTFELYGKTGMKAQLGGSCLEFVGDAASGTTYNYAFIVGSDGKTYRYDLFGDFVGERTDASALGKVTDGYMATYYASSSSSSATRKPILYNETTLYQPGNGKVTYRDLEGYRIVNMCTFSNKNVVFVLFESIANPGTYCIKSTTGTLGTFKDVQPDFTPGKLNMDRNSIMVGTRNSMDAYYSFENRIYRWGLSETSASVPPSAARIELPAGEVIRSMATNYMGDFNNGTEETLLYVATYNPDRAGEKKGSLYIYRFEDDTLVKSYEGICDDPVKVLYKYRIS